MRHSAIAACAAILIVGCQSPARAIPFAASGIGVAVGTNPFSNAFSRRLVDEVLTFSKSEIGTGIANGPVLGSALDRFVGVTQGASVYVGAALTGPGSASIQATYTGRIRFTNTSALDADPQFDFYALGIEHGGLLGDPLTESGRVFARGTFRVDVPSAFDNSLPATDCGSPSSFNRPPPNPFCDFPFRFSQAGSLGVGSVHITVASGESVDVVFAFEVSASISSTAIGDVPEPAIAAFMLAGLVGIAAARRR